MALSRPYFMPASSHPTADIAPDDAYDAGALSLHSIIQERQ